MKDGGDIGMLRTQHVLFDGQRPLIEGFGLDILPLEVVEAGQVMENLQDIRMLGTQRLLPQGEGALQEGFGLGELSALAQIASCHMEETGGLWEGEAILRDPLGSEQGMGQAPLTALPLPDVSIFSLGKGPVHGPDAALSP